MYAALQGMIDTKTAGRKRKPPGGSGDGNAEAEKLLLTESMQVSDDGMPKDRIAGCRLTIECGFVASVVLLLLLLLSSATILSAQSFGSPSNNLWASRRKWLMCMRCCLLLLL
jgi:hypothetical protein